MFKDRLFEMKLSYHSIMVDMYIELGLNDVIDAKKAAKMADWHISMMRTLMCDKYGTETIAKIMTYYTRQEILEQIENKKK